MPVIAYIGIGSNMGDKKANVRKAVEMLGETMKVLASSSLYYTEAVGYAAQDDFRNAVVKVETDLPPRELLRACRAIEDKLGRLRLVRWGPRTVDLDILLYGNLAMDEPDLIIPHPRMTERKFVLVPLVEIAPAAFHPVLQKTAAKLLDEVNDAHTVMKCNPECTLP